MAEITNEIDWLKACNHLVLENYADADAWGWDGSGGVEPSDVELEANQLWRLGRSEFYEYFNPIHRAIFGCLCWHMNPEAPPEGAIPSWATENHGVDQYRMQLERLFLELDCPLTWIPEDEEAEVQPVEVEPVEVEVAPPKGGNFLRPQLLLPRSSRELLKSSNQSWMYDLSSYRPRACWTNSKTTSISTRWA